MLLEFTDDDRAAFRLFWELSEATREAMNARIMAAAEKIPAFAELLKSMPPAERERSEREGNARQRAALLDGKWDAYLDDARVQGTTYAKMGIEFSAWFDLMRSYRAAIGYDAARFFKGDVDKVVKALHGCDQLIDIAMATIGEAYLGTKQEIIANQSRAIRELSTPVLQVKPRLLVVPLVGVIDTERARQVTENVLHSIRARRARVVIIDVTGVPVVDSKVANHLMQTVSAAGLMGAQVIVCGMSPEIAQTLVVIGAELRGVRTAGDLQEGIEEADDILARYADGDGDGNDNGVRGHAAREGGWHDTGAER